MIPVGIFVCLNSSETGYELHNALEDGDVGDGDELFSDVEDRLKQRRCFIIPVVRSGLKATYSMFFVLAVVKEATSCKYYKTAISRLEDLLIHRKPHKQESMSSHQWIN